MFDNVLVRICDKEILSGSVESEWEASAPFVAKPLLALRLGYT